MYRVDISQLVRYSRACAQYSDFLDRAQLLTQKLLKQARGRRGHDRMVVGFTTTYEISTKVVSSNLAHGEVYSIQHYVMKFLITTWICTYH